MILKKERGEIEHGTRLRGKKTNRGKRKKRERESERGRGRERKKEREVEEEEVITLYIRCLSSAFIEWMECRK